MRSESEKTGPLIDCCSFNYEITPATLGNTFLFILQGSALADLRYGGRFYYVFCSEFLSATVKELLKLDNICQSYVQMKKGPVFPNSQWKSSLSDQDRKSTTSTDEPLKHID